MEETTENPQPEPQVIPQPQAPIARGPSKWQNIKVRLKDFLRECLRVLRITKKPDKIEFKTIVKISGLGIIVIGMIGFIIHLFKELLF